MIGESGFEAQAGRIIVSGCSGVWFEIKFSGRQIGFNNFLLKSEWLHLYSTRSHTPQLKWNTMLETVCTVAHKWQPSPKPARTTPTPQPHHIHTTTAPHQHHNRLKLVWCGCGAIHTTPTPHHHHNRLKLVWCGCGAVVVLMWCGCGASWFVTCEPPWIKDIFHFSENSQQLILCHYVLTIVTDCHNVQPGTIGRVSYLNLYLWYLCF